MQSKSDQLSERFLGFASGILKLSSRLHKTVAGRHVAGQLMRSGTSAGANYEEACGAESRQDFIHKLQIALKELRESLYWLRLIQKSEFLSERDADFSTIIREAEELTSIIAKSIVTAKKNRTEN